MPNVFAESIPIDTESEPPKFGIFIHAQASDARFKFEITSIEDTIPVLVILSPAKATADSAMITITSGVEYTVVITSIPDGYTLSEDDDAFCQIDDTFSYPSFTASAGDAVYCDIYFDYSPIVVDTPEETVTKKSGGGCADCIPPTIGLDTNYKRIVENGFSYNDNPVNVVKWYTPYPLITAIVNQTNTVEIIAYDNQGIYNLKVVQFGLGIKELGQGLHDAEVVIEVHLESLRSEDTVIVEKTVIRDRDNLIDTFSVFADTDVVKCFDGTFDVECLKVTLQYAYREATINNMMVVNVQDKPGNSQNFYFNEGVEVIGESLNEPPTYELQNRKTRQQTTDFTLTLTRTDKVNHIWMDKYGVEYMQISDNRFDRLTPAKPYTCSDPLLSEINVPTRSNCHFREQTLLWK